MNFEEDNDNDRSIKLSIWNLSNEMSLENSNSINNIDASLFQNPEKKWDLDKFFFNEKQPNANFIKNQSSEFDSVIRGNLKWLNERKNYIFEKFDKIRDKKNYKILEKKSSLFLQTTFSNHIDDIFKFPNNQNSQNTDYPKKILSNYFKFCYHSLSGLLKVFFKFLEEENSVLTSKTSISKKRIPWCEKEELDLLEIMENQYPFQISNISLKHFSDKYNRTKSAIVNKIQKLKKKYSSKFTIKSDQIINDCVNGNKNNLISLKEKILNSLSEKPITFEDILKSLNITETEIQTEDSVNGKLYDLMNNRKIKSKEIFFVEFTNDFKNYRKNNKSIIIKFIYDKMIDSKFDISFEKTKNMLGERFKEMDLNKKDFDFELMSFLKNSLMFVIKQKRVFYM